MFIIQMGSNNHWRLIWYRAALLTMFVSNAFSTHDAPETADAAFMQCCIDQPRVRGGCYKYCKFEQFNIDVLSSLYLGSADCPRRAMGAYLFCAGSGYDHRAHCVAHGVGDTGAGQKCVDFCNMTPGTRLTLSWSHLPCWSVMSTVRNIFQRHANSKQLLKWHMDKKKNNLSVEKDNLHNTTTVSSTELPTVSNNRDVVKRWFATRNRRVRNPTWIQPRT